MMLVRLRGFVLVAVVVFGVGVAALGDGGGFTVVKLDAGAPAALQLAVQACAGLDNRASGGSAYVRMDANDDKWLVDLGLKPEGTVEARDYLDACLVRHPACVRYSYKDQQALLPSILTAASALGAVPVDAGLAAGCREVALDAVVELKERNTPVLATRYVFEKFIGGTTGLAMLNPGYDLTPKDFSAPGLTRDMPPDMVDFVFSQKLFVVFLVNGCENGEPERALLQEILNAGQWPTPVGVFGYNDSWGAAGYLHEAQTRCLDSRNMGAIPTKTNNLSFFSTRSAPVADAGELKRNKPEEVEYDPAMTYVAFVVGDGDNVSFIMSARKHWLGQRLADCAKADNSCAPLTWSISPHLARIAPDVLKWYFEAGSRTGKDYFILPPSGHLYAYPTSLNKEDQDRFVAATERDARILGVSGTVHWDWFETWNRAEKSFLPKYARADGAIRGMFTVNVPYMLPTFTWWPASQFYKVMKGKDGGRAVVFRPREWRGVDGKGVGPDVPFYLTPRDMANEIGGYPRGTVTWVYMTSDGGLSLENSFMELVKILPPHVRIVSADAAAKLALTAGR